MATVILKPQYRFGVLIGEDRIDSVLAGREISKTLMRQLI
jgi:hypothetical protein